MLIKEVQAPVHNDNGFVKILGAGIAAMGIFLAGAQMGRASSQDQKYDALIAKQNELLLRYDILNNVVLLWAQKQVRSSGANNLTNYGIYSSASGGQTNYALYTDRGDVQINGNTTMGDAMSDAHTINGNLTINGTLTVKPDGSTERLRVVK